MTTGTPQSSDATEATTISADPGNGSGAPHGQGPGSDEVSGAGEVPGSGHQGVRDHSVPPPARPVVGPAFLLFVCGVAPGVVGRSAWTIALVTLGFTGYKAWTGRKVWGNNLAVKGRGVLAPMIAATLVVQGVLAAALHGMGALLAGDRGALLAGRGVEALDIAWALGVPLLAAAWAEWVRARSCERPM